MIAVRRGEERERLPAVSRAEGAGVEDVHRVGGLRVGIDVCEVPGALPVPLVVVHALPGVAGVVGAIEPAFLRLDERVDAIAVGAGDAHTDAAQDPFREPAALEALPGRPGVGRAIEPAALAAAGEAPRRAVHLPQ